MSTNRQNILGRIEDDLQALSTIKKVENNKSGIFDIETVPLPCAFIYPGPETRVNGVIGYESWIWKIYIEIWAKDKDMETLLEDVHEKLFSDERLGGYADRSYRTGADIMFVDPERSLEDLIIEYTVEHKHLKGAM